VFTGQFNRASQRIFITPAAAAPDTTASTKGKTNHATTQVINNNIAVGRWFKSVVAMPFSRLSDLSGLVLSAWVHYNILLYTYLRSHSSRRPSILIPPPIPVMRLLFSANASVCHRDKIYRRDQKKKKIKGRVKITKKLFPSLARRKRLYGGKTVLCFYRPIGINVNAVLNSSA